jgi:hypothetical protein
VSKQEDEIMGLYAIAREEMDGVHGACDKLHGVIARLDNVTSHIQHNARNGIESSLSDFKRQVDTNLREKVTNAVLGLENATNEAKNSLRKQEKLYWLICFCVGMLSGACLTYFTLSDYIISQSVYQERTYKEVLGLRAHFQKAKVKHKRKVATQNIEESESGTSSVGGEEESQ